MTSTAVSIHVTYRLGITCRIPKARNEFLWRTTTCWTESKELAPLAAVKVGSTSMAVPLPPAQSVPQTLASSEAANEELLEALDAQLSKQLEDEG
jgi:hypothetical protein